MKSLSNFAIYSLLAISCFLFSCSNDIYYENEKTNQSKVIVDLENLNNELLSTVTPSTRGWSRWNKQEKMKVVSADLFGAWNGAKAGLFYGAKAGIGIGAPHLVGGGFCALGALVGGAYSSWMAAPTRANNNDFDKIQSTCRVIVTGDLKIRDVL